MIVYRVGSQLFASQEDDGRRRMETFLVYGGDDILPTKFYTYEKTLDNETKYCLIIVDNGTILVNFGSYQEIKQCIWLSFETGKNDPIDFKFVFLRNMIMVEFLYDDLLIGTIDLKNKNPHIEYHEGKNVLDQNIFPFKSAHDVSEREFFSIISLVDDKVYDVQIRRGNSLFSFQKGEELGPGLTDFNKYYFALYSNGHIVCNGVELQNIIKARDTYCLSNDGVFGQISPLKVFGVIATGVVNFHKNYLIKNDQLVFKKSLSKPNSEEQILLESGASQITFPITSSYDEFLNARRSHTKSARGY